MSPNSALPHADHERANEPSAPESLRRSRQRAQARHAATHSPTQLSSSFEALGELALSGARVSASVTDVESGVELLAIDERFAMPLASVGKILLLIELSARLTARDPLAVGLVERSSVEHVADSGLWQHLQAPVLPTLDLGTLVAATSDNLATNVLLQRFGLDAIRTRAESLGLRQTAVLDRIRDSRGPDDAPHFAVGSTIELAWLIAALARGEVVDSATSQRVMGWLSLNCDLSMVASAFGLDPLAHRSKDHGIRLVNKTGSDRGVRVDVGVITGPSRSLAYAVAVTFDDSNLSNRLRALDTMRVVGRELLSIVAP